MSIAGRLKYYQRIFSAYATTKNSQLTFWHDRPEINPNAILGKLGEYYMPFFEKADYAGPHDPAGIPMLDYHGAIGLQSNPIAIAQWGLGNYNLFQRSKDEKYRSKFLAAADWLRAHLEQSSSGVWVWNHYFDWEYRTPLRAPWYSGLAQGQGISLLLRAHHATGDPGYLQAAQKAFVSFLKSTNEGGVTFTDAEDNVWFEEYIVSPPTHILNGFIWAAWGVYDYGLATGDISAQKLFAKAVKTMRENLSRYDLGFWSLYEQSGTRLPMVASPFYHQLHIVQLRIMRTLTGDDTFAHYADRWEAYSHRRANRARALCYKSAFKLLHY